MNKRFLSSSIIALLFLIGSASSAQTLAIQFFTSTDYSRPPSFVEQDLIYGRKALYNQGLELICSQDKVKVDIQGLGTYYTPLDLNNIPSGDYRVELTKTGYYPYLFTVNIKSDGRSSVEVNLKPYVVRLNLENLPPQSVVYINNQKIEGNSAEVTPGEVSLRIKAFGFEDFFQVIDVGTEGTQSFAPELIPRPFRFTAIDANRETLWLGDSPSQKIFRFAVRASAPGTGDYRIIRERDNSIVQQGPLIIERERTLLTLDFRDSDADATGAYRLEVSGSDKNNEDKLERSVTVSQGGKSRWRNSFTGSAGFLYCPEAGTLPAGVSQIQTGFNPSFTAVSLEDLVVPAFLTLRTGITDRIEITAGTALFLAQDTDSSSFDLHASGKFMIYGYEGDRAFAMSAALSANYNGKATAFGSVPPFDPYGGVTGVSLSVPLRFSAGIFSVLFTPEIRFSPSYPMKEPGGFTGGELYIWNYFKGALVLDTGPFSAALSAALQSPSYLHGGGGWPLYGGLEVSLSPGKTGFTVSLFGGIRHLSGDDPVGTAGLTAGFIW